TLERHCRSASTDDSILGFVPVSTVSPRAPGAAFPATRGRVPNYPRMDKMVTIADVAEAANVSISTVSYAMSGKRKISRETQERIARAIAELGYRPHASARALASRSTSIIGLQAP